MRYNFCVKNYRKIATLILCVVLCALTALCFFACKDKNKDKPEDKGYVVLSFDTGWEGIVIEPIILDGKEDKVMPDDPQKAGYTFLGWYLDKDFLVKFNPEAHSFTEDATLYARWLKNGVPGFDEPTLENPKDFNYRKETASDGSNYYVVTEYVAKKTEAVVPTRYNGYPVTKIGDGAFENNSFVTKISFGVNISAVGKGAFRGCSSLKEISVTEGNPIFKSVNGFLYNLDLTTLLAAPAKSEQTSVVFGKEMNHIHEYALENCCFAVSFADGSKYSIIEKNAFAGFSGALTVGKSVTAIEQYAFKNAAAEISFGADCVIEEIGMGAFDGYKGKTLTLPGSVKSIVGHAFSGCTAQVDLSKTGISVISSNGFAGYRGESLTIPVGVTDIMKNAFYQSTAKITFAAGSAYSVVKSESFSMFYGEVVFPFTVTSVEKNAFWQSRAKVSFDRKQADIGFASGYDADFKGEFIYLEN